MLPVKMFGLRFGWVWIHRRITINPVQFLKDFQQSRPRLALILTLLFIALAVLIVYLPALGNGLVWDDHITFEQAPDYRQLHLAGILRAISEPLIYSNNYFRPLPVLTFILQLKWFGLDPWGLHLFSVMMHLLNTVLLSCLIWILLDGARPDSTRLLYVLLGGLVYGFHPALIEPTAFISSRFDLMTTFFLAIALILDQIRLRPVVRVLTIAVAFLFAALSKEMALALPACLPFYHIATLSNRPSKFPDIVRRVWLEGHGQTYIALILGGIVYLGLRYSVLGYLLEPAIVERSDIGNTLQHIALVGLSLSQYLLLIFYPFGSLSPSHMVTIPVSLSNPHAWSGLLLLVLAIGITLVQHLRRHPNLGWYLLAILASLFPILNVVATNRPTDAFFSESFLVFPIFITVLLLTVAWYRAQNTWKLSISDSIQKIFPVIPLAWIALGIVSVVTTTGLWKNDINLWGYVLYKQNKVNQLALNNYGNGLIADGQIENALQVIQLSVKTYPDNSAGWHGLAITLSKLDRYAEAEQAEKRAIELNPNKPQYYVSMGYALYKQDRLKAAKKAYLEAYRINPEYVPALTSLAYLSEIIGNYRDADQYMSRAIALALDGPEKQRLRAWLEEAEARRKTKK